MTPNPPDPTASPAPAPPRRSWPRRLLRAAIFGLLALPLAYLIAANLWLATGAHQLAGRRPEKFQADWSSAYSLWPGRVTFRDLELRGRNRKILWSASLAAGSAKLSWPELFTRQVRVEQLRGHGFRFRIRPRHEASPIGAPEEPDAEEAEEKAATASPATATYSSAQPAIPGGAPPFPPIPGFEGLAEPQRSTKLPWTIEIDHFELDDVEEVWIERYHYLAEAPGGRFTGTLHLRLRRSVELPEFHLELARGQLAVEDRQLARLEKCRLVGELLPFVTRRYKLLEFSRFLKAELELEASDSDLGALEYYLRGSPLVLGGLGRLQAHIFLDQGVVGAGSRLAVAEAMLELSYLTYWGRGKGSVAVAVEPEQGENTGRLKARLDDFQLGVAGATAAHLRGTGLEVTATTQNLDLGDPRPRLSGEIRMPATEIPDFRVYNSLWPTSFPLELESGKAQLKSTLRFDTTEVGHRAEGEVELSGRGIRAVLLDNLMVGDFRLAASLKSDDLASRRFELHGTRLEIQNLSGDWQPETRGWWANIVIPRGHLGLGNFEQHQPRSFDFEVEAELADTSPLVAALLAKKPAFDWLSRLLTIRQLRLKTRVALQGGSLRLSRLNLEGGSRLAIRGELILDNKKADGAFHLEYGPLAAAVRLEPGGDRDWKLLHSAEAYAAWLVELQRKRR